MKRDRFKKQKKGIAFSVVIPLVSFIFIFGLFYYGINEVNAASDRQILDSLKTAVHRDIVHCYATEGEYPPSIEYIEEKYGLTYDHSRFVIDYQVVGTNILPEVTVLEVKR